MELLVNKDLTIKLLDDAVHVMSDKCKDVGIRIEVVKHILTPDAPKEAMYRINLINSREEIRSGGGYVLSSGEFLKFGKELKEYHLSHPRL